MAIHPVKRLEFIELVKENPEKASLESGDFLSYKNRVSELIIDSIRELIPEGMHTIKGIKDNGETTIIEKVYIPITGLVPRESFHNPEPYLLSNFKSSNITIKGLYRLVHESPLDIEELLKYKGITRDKLKQVGIM